MSDKTHSFPKDTPIKPALSEQLENLFSKMDASELDWLRGYLNGLIPAQSQAAEPLLILYGTESGNAESLAEQTVERAHKLGIRTQIANMADLKLTKFAQFKHLLLIVSTWGEGDPPETATDFYEAIMGDSAPQLADLNYSVLALGDTSYEHFCKTGKDFDARLETLGGKRLHPRVDCDVDFDDDYSAWADAVLKAFAPLLTSDSKGACMGTNLDPKPKAAIAYSRKNPCLAPLSERIHLNGSGSAKNTLHLEFDLSGSGLRYEVGDSLAVQPKNSEALVNLLLESASFDPECSVSIKGESHPLKEALISELDITTLSIPFLTRYNAKAENAQLTALLDRKDKSKIQDYIQGRDCIDLLQDFPAPNLSAQDFVDLLRKLPPRLYSIASSQKAHPDSVHLTVGVVRYPSQGRTREGVCSTFLAERIEIDSVAKVFVTPNKNFKLPKDSEAPIIMVGPGTGIAPFRAFIQERKAMNAQGKNWLFFGDQHFLSDFLYQAEWQTYQKEGVLNKIDLAFSRDQKEKVYVQDKMKANASELYQWLQSGAYFYVCGDASRMAKDVDTALHEIVQSEAGFSEAEAEAYIKQLKTEKRYLRDVYWFLVQTIKIVVQLSSVLLSVPSFSSRNL